MRQHRFGSGLASLVLLASALFAASPAFAVPTQYRLFIDRDNNPVTGCTVALPSGPMIGVEDVITKTVNTTTAPNAATVVLITQRVCTAPPSTFTVDAIIYPGPHPVGLGNGNSGLNVIEGFWPLPDPKPLFVRVALVATDDAGGTDELSTTLPGGTNPIIIALGSIPEIPTLSTWGFLGLSLVLFGCGAWVLRRRKALVAVCFLVLGAASAVWAATVVLDGLIGDWAPGTLVAIDAPGDGTVGSEIVALFAQVDNTNNRLGLRVDGSLQFNQTPIANAQSVTTDEDTPVLITLTGSDPDAEPLTFSIDNFPANGGLSAILPLTPTSASVTYSPNLNTNGPDSFLFRVTDPSGGFSTATVSITVNPINDAPVLLASGGAVTFVEDGPPVFVDPGITVTDPDNPNLASATVTITNPLDGAADVLGASNCAALTVTPGVNSLAITGSQPVATYQACLASVTYANTSNDPDTTSRGISFVANDGTANSNTITPLVAISPNPDAPTVTTSAGSAGFVEDGGPVTVDPAVTVTDADDLDLVSASVTITNPQDGAAEVLAAAGCGALTVTPGLNNLAITGTQPLATYQTCLQSVTYNNTSQDPTALPDRVVSFVVNDGTSNSPAATRTVLVAPVNDPPVVTTSGGSTAFTEDGGPVVVDAAVTVTDADDATLASATVTITNPIDTTAEVLAATACPGLTVTPGVNTLAISGSQPVATYQACLASVTYNNTSQNPDLTARVISFLANDGTAPSAVANKTVTVAAAADAPVITTTAGVTTFTEDGGPVVVDSGVTVTDADDTNLESATISLVAAPDGAAEILNATACGALVVTPGNPLTITGSQPVATYQTCLQSVTYNNTDQDPDPTGRTVNFVANDGDGNSNTATKAITITAANDAPVVTTTGGTTAFSEDGPAVVVDGGVTVTDADNANLASAAVTITNPQDGAAEVLGATACPGLTVTPGPNSVSITGAQPLATYQTCLQSVTYNNTDQDPEAATPRVLAFVANDGTTSSTPANKTVTVAAVNDPPVVQTTGGPTPFIEDGPAVVVDAGLLVTDADNANLASATVTITNLQDAGVEALAATACGAFTVGGSGTGTLTITGSQPLATYETCLRSVTYANTSQNPTESPSRSISFVANDGAAPSAAAFKTVTVQAVNDLPVVTTSAGTTAFTEDGPAVVVDGAVTVTDADHPNLSSALVTITNPLDGAAEALNATACPGITVTPGVNSLSLNGSALVATYQACLQSVTYNNTDQDPDTTTRVLQFVASDATGSSLPANKSVSVAAVADAPVVTTTGGVTAFTEDGPAVVVDAGVTVTDGDSTNLASATITITNVQDVGAEALAAGACGAFTVGGSGTPTLSITGSQSPATYQSCLQSVTYNNTSQNPTGPPNRSISFVANDGAASSTPVFKAVSVTPVNDAPVVTTTGGITPFTEDAGAVVVDNGLTVTDVDDTNLESASASIVTVLDVGFEALGATACGALTVTPGNPLTVTGTATLAVYQTCLRSVTYNNLDQDPNTTNRTINFLVNDGDVNSNTAAKTVSVTAVNDPPAPTTNPISYATVGNTQLHVAGKTLAGVANTSDAVSIVTKAGPFVDPDGPVAPAIVDASGASTNGGTFDVDTNGSFVYVPPAAFTGTDSFTYQITDTLATFNATVNVTITDTVWYVRDVVDANNPAAGDTGLSTNAFEVLGDVEPVVTDNDYIFVFRGNTGTTPLDGGIDIDNTGVKLHGQGVGLTVPGFTTLIPAGAQPRITNTGAAGAPEDNGVNVVATAASLVGVEIKGLEIGGRDNSIDVNATGANNVTVEISDNTILNDAATGLEGVDVNAASTGTATLSFHDNTLTARGSALDFTRTAGTAFVSAFHDNVVTAASQAAGLVVTGTGGVVTFDATPAGPIQPVPGGTTVLGTPGDRIGGAGLSLSNVTGALNFANAAAGTIAAGDLDIFSDTGAALNAAGGAGGFDLDVTTNAGVLVGNAGPAAVLSGLDADIQLNSLGSSNSAGAGVSLTNVTGTFSAPSGSSIINAGTTDFLISGGTANVTYGGTITDDVGQLVSIASTTAGTKSFTGAITDGVDGDGSGISITGNSNSPISFTGGVTLSTGNNPAFAATTNNVGALASLTVTGTNTIATTTGTALNVVNTTIGAGGMTFVSISSNGATSGIVLNATGTLGGLTVSGTGGAATGGTIQNSTSFGISLTNTRNVNLSSLNITNGGNHGINVSSVTNFIYQDATILSAGDGNDEQAINLLNVFGTTNLIEDVVLDDITEDGIQIRQNATDDGTMDTLTIRRLNVQDHVAGFGESGIEAQPDLASNFRVIVDDSDFTLNTNAVIAAAGSTAASHTGTFVMTIQNSTFNCAASFGSGGPQFLGGGSGTVFYTVDTNQILGTKFSGLILNADQTQTTHARVINNIITGSGATNNGRGIEMRQDDNSRMLALVSGNNISQVKSDGIKLNGQDATIDDAELELEATVLNNVVTVRSDGFGAGIIIESGVGVALQNDLCVDISGNNPVGTDTSPFFDTDIVLNILDTNATMRVRQTAAAVSTGNSGANFTNFANPPAVIVFNGGTCTAPTLPPT